MNIGIRGLIVLVHVNSKDANQLVRKRRLIGINVVPRLGNNMILCPNQRPPANLSGCGDALLTIQPD